MDNFQIAQKKIFRDFIFWVVSNSLFVCLISNLFFDSSFPFWSNCWDNWKRYFLVPGSFLYLCFESLGLDITSVIFNRFCFQKWRQHAPFCDLFLSKNHTTNWFLYDPPSIEQVLSITTNFRFLFQNCSNRILSISISKIYLRSLFQLIDWY